MAGREVERLEVVPVVLDLGSAEQSVAEADEDVLQLAPDLGDEVEVTAPVAAAAERQVERGAGRPAGGLRLELLTPRRERGLDRGARLVDGAADVLALRHRRRLDR